jgi:hypothetical protein
MSKLTFDLVLLYYDKPEILDNWFIRLLNHSDYLKFKNISNIIIADSGSPLDRVEETLKIIRKYKDQCSIIYSRADTDELRKTVPEDIDARPACHAYNMAALDISTADVIFTSVIGQIFTPEYFSRILVEHIKNDKAVVLSKRFDLICSTYHSDLFDSNFSEIEKFSLQPSGGWPDMSVRRKWLQEVGGWDENYITISPVDMDLGSRLTGKLDNGMPSEFLFTFKGKFDNLNLDFIQPFTRSLCYSLTCNQYPGHRPTGDSRRQKGYDLGIKYYLENWNKIIRNENRIPINFKIYEI